MKAERATLRSATRAKTAAQEVAFGQEADLNCTALYTRTRPAQVNAQVIFPRTSVAFKIRRKPFRQLRNSFALRRKPFWPEAQVIGPLSGDRPPHSSNNM